MAKNRKTNFLAQGGILALAGIISRLIGMLYRIPMIAIIGEEGMGVYSSAYSIYSIMLIISSYSLPMSVSKLVSAKLGMKQFKNVKRIFAVSFAFGTVLGMAVALLMYFGADFLALNISKMPEAAMAIKTLAPTVFIMGMLGVVRGFFQGHGSMIPTAVSQILEQILHVAVSLLAGYYLFQKGLAMDAAGSNVYASTYGAVGATIGTGVGALSALLFVLFIYLLYRKSLLLRCEKDQSAVLDSYGVCLRSIALTALPIIISAALSNIISLADQAIYGSYVAVDFRQIWGVYTSKYSVLINVPVAVASALSASTLPAISSEIARGERRTAMQKAARAIRVIVLISLPASLGLTLLGKPCFDLLFRSTSNVLAGQMMYFGGMAVLFTSLSTICVGILQGSGYFWTPIKNYLLALILHFPLLYFFLYVVRLDIQAVVLGNMLYSFCCAVFNMISLKQKLSYRQEYAKTFFGTFISSLIMALIAWGAYQGLYALKLGNALSLLISILLALLVYLVAILLMGVLGEKELSMLPGGGLLLKLAGKFKLLR